MADADRTLKILLELQANTAGAEQAKAAIADLKQTTASVATESKGVADQLAAAGARFDPVSKTFKSITEESKAAGVAWEATGLSIARARNEAVTLIRELAVGAPTARTIGALVGALGLQIGIAGIAAYSVLRAIESWVDATIKAALEQAKFADAMNKTQLEAIQLANLASKFDDVVRAEEHMLRPVDQLIEKLRQAEVPVHGFQALLEKFGSFEGFSFYHPTADQVELVKKYSDAIKELVSRAEGIRQLGIDQAAAFEKIKAEPLAQAFDEVKNKVAELTAKSKELETQIKETTSKEKVAQLGLELVRNDQALALWQKRLQEIGDSEDKLSEKVDQTAAAIDRVDLQKLSPQERIEALKKQIEETTEKLKFLGAETPREALELILLGKVSKDTAEEMLKLVNALTRLQVEENREEAAASRAGASAERKDLLADLRQQEQLIQRIRQTQELINANPFLSADEKAHQSLQSMISEMQSLQTYIERLNAEKLKPLDSAELEQVNGKLQQTRFELELLREKAAALQAPLAAGLIQWANSFGTAAQVAANAITGTLNTAISGTANALTGLITGTKNWQQAFQQAAVSIINEIIRIGIQFVVTRILMSVISRTASASEAGHEIAHATQVAAAWAPGATAASVATEGEAAGIGLTAYLAAIAAGIAGTVPSLAGAESGGYAGDLPTHQIAGVFHGGEFIFSAPAVRNIGVKNLEAAHEAARNMSSGDSLTSTSSPSGGRRGGDVHNHILVFDTAEAMRIVKNNREASNHVIDLVRNRKIELGV